MAKKKSGTTASKRASILAAKRSARRAKEAEDPLEVRLTVAFRFGDQPEDRIVMLDDRRIPMVGSVFRYRDRIVRSGSFMMLRAGLASPKVVAELVPPLRWIISRDGSKK